MDQTNSQHHSSSPPGTADCQPPDARSPAIKAISNLAIQLRAVDNSISNTSADAPQGNAVLLPLLL